MSDRTPAQSAANHNRLVVGFHVVTAMLAMAYVVWAAIRVIRQPSGDTAMMLVGAIAILLVGWYARTFPLAVQDRLIRLEERLRFAALLPPELLSRSSSLTEAQYIGLRFASDAEVPALVKRALDENLTQKQIKEAIVNWRPDYFRV